MRHIFRDEALKALGRRGRVKQGDLPLFTKKKVGMANTKETAVVTGGSRGLGRGVVEALVAKWMRVVAVADLGRAAIAAYAEREGITGEAFAKRFGPPLTPAIMGQAVVDLHDHADRWNQLAYRVGGAGLAPIS